LIPREDPCNVAHPAGKKKSAAKTARYHDRFLAVLLLGQTSLRLGEADEAIRQAKLVLDVNKDQPDALLLEAQRCPRNHDPFDGNAWDGFHPAREERGTRRHASRGYDRRRNCLRHLILPRAGGRDFVGR
jgi:hypothetical protein